MSQPTADLFAALQRALEPQYRLEHELGRGGMGVVFLATDTALDRRVAIKVVHPELAAHASIVRRFLAEARTIAKVRHPSIVAVHSAGTADDLLYYVMDEVAGESLRQRIAREGRLPVADVSRIVADLAAALDAAGRAGVVHRDVKPENVLLEEGSGRAMLADFGIARAMVVETGGSSTGQGVAVGTPAYMSPEQAAGEEVDRRSDIYALGVVAYEMLAGHPPFTGTNRVVVSRHIAERPAPIEKARPDCPRPLAAAIMRSLEKQPNDRWQSGEELRQAIVSERVAPVRSRKRQGLMVAAVIALAAVGTTLGVARRNEGPPAGVNPRHSMLILPFDNLRKDQSTDWMREGSVSMLGLNLAQWNDLTVVDHERMHDLLAKQDVKAGRQPGSGDGTAPRAGRRRLDRRARRFHPGRRLTAPRGPGLRRGDGRAGGRGPGGRSQRRRRAPPLRSARRQAARPLRRAERARDRPGPVHHAIAGGLPGLPHRCRAAEPLGSGGCRDRAGPRGRDRLRVRAGVLQAGADPRLAGGHQRLDRRPGDGARDGPFDQAAGRTNAPSSTRTARSSAASSPAPAISISSSSPAIPRTPTRGTGWARPGTTTPPG